jgi:(5-formylfuran-3-yl)methyl phosphate synthase
MTLPDRSPLALGLPRPRFLASVRDVGEALLAVRLGAEVIDLKEPRQGALGAVPLAEQARILAALGPSRPIVSATVGDLPLDPHALAAAIRRTSSSGVDVVKFGVFAAGEAALAGLAALDAELRRAPPPTQLVPLFFADRLPGIDQAITLGRAALRVAGVSGVMLDTADKEAGALPEIFDCEDLAAFATAVQETGGFAGLAGSLRLEHIPTLAVTGANLLGFRCALCLGGRTGTLDEAAFRAVRDRLRAVRRTAALAT